MSSDKEKQCEKITEIMEMTIEAVYTFKGHKQEFNDAALASKRALDTHILQTMLDLFKNTHSSVFEGADPQVVDETIQTFNNEGKKILDSFVESILSSNKKVYENLMVGFKEAIQKMNDSAYKD